MEITYGELLLGVNEKYSDEILVETSVDTAERGGADRVISLEAEAKAASVELLEGEAEVSGKVNYRLLYLDRQARLCGLDYFKDFKCRVKGDAIAPKGNGEVSFLVPDAEARISGDEITLSAVVEVMLTYHGEMEKPCVMSVEEAETLAVEVVTQRVEERERTIAIDKVADVGLGVKKIVLFRADALPLSVTEEASGVTVSGEVRGTILYLNEADEVVELTVSLPFSEASDGEASDYAAVVRSARVVLTDDEEGNVVEVEATVVITERIYRDIARNAIAAACGEKQRVEEKTECICPCRYIGREVYEEKLGGTITLDEDLTLAFVRPGCHAIADVTVGDGEIKVEGVSAFRIVGMAEDGYRSVQGELPFVYVLPFAEAREGMTAEVSMVVTDAVGVGKNKDVNIAAKVCLEVKLYEKKCYYYLSEVREGDMLPESDAGVSVYFAEKGEDLWSIAKSMGVLPSALVRANPFLSEPLEEAKKVLIFREK